MTVIMIYMTDFSVKHKRLSRNRWRHGHVTGGLEPGRGAALRISRPGMSRVRRTCTPGWRDRQAPPILSVILTGAIRMESRAADTVADGLGPGVAL